MPYNNNNNIMTKNAEWINNIETVLRKFEEGPKGERTRRRTQVNI